MWHQALAEDQQPGQLARQQRAVGGDKLAGPSW
jgi:hypothetical protein